MEIYSPSWDELNRDVELLFEKIKEAEYRPDLVICLARGGMHSGNLISRMLNKPLGILATSTYKGVGERSERASCAENLTCMRPVKGKILIVDDIIDTGLTIRAAECYMKAFDGVSEIKTAVVWRKNQNIHGDFVGREFYPPVPWIVQPFEIYDDDCPI